MIDKSRKVIIDKSGAQESAEHGFITLWRKSNNYIIESGVLKDIGSQTELYHPLSEENIVQDFSSIANENDILEFAKTYGSLGYKYFPKPDKGITDDPVSWILTHAKTVNMCKRLQYYINTNDSTSLDDYINDLNNNASFTFYGNQEKIVSHDFCTKGDVFELANFIVRVIVNENITGIHRTLQYFDGKNKSFFSFRALIEVIYWKLANVIDGGIIKKCEAEGCEGFFIKTDKRQRYCPPKFAQKESACAIRERVRRSRK